MVTVHNQPQWRYRGIPPHSMGPRCGREQYACTGGALHPASVPAGVAARPVREPPDQVAHRVFERPWVEVELGFGLGAVDHRVVEQRPDRRGRESIRSPHAADPFAERCDGFRGLDRQRDERTDPTVQTRGRGVRTAPWSPGARTADSSRRSGRGLRRPSPRRRRRGRRPSRTRRPRRRAIGRVPQRGIPSWRAHGGVGRTDDAGRIHDDRVAALVDEPPDCCLADCLAVVVERTVGTGPAARLVDPGDTGR